jgi:hypothetical protein
MTLGTLPDDDGDWPVLCSLQSDKPDNQIAVMDTPGIIEGRSQVEGEVQEHFGVQLLIRASTPNVAFAKTRNIAVSLDQGVVREVVNVDTATYLVQSITRVGNPHSLGRESPTSNRHLYSINTIVSVRQTN